MSASTSASSTPPSEEADVSETSSMIQISSDSVSAPSVDLEVLLEKQLLLEKTRVGSLTNDNQRLLSQNISLCQAIKQQKLDIDHLCTQNNTLKGQVSKLFVSVTRLNQTNQKGNDFSNALKQEFDVLKQAILEKQKLIGNLQTTNHKLSLSLEQSHREKDSISDQLNQLKRQNQEYQCTIQCHLDSITEFNDTIKEMQTAMKKKQNEMNSVLEQKQQKEEKLQNAQSNIEDLQSEKAKSETEIQSLSEQIESMKSEIASYCTQIQQHETLQSETFEKLEGEQTKYEEVVKQREWWKSEATALEKECQLNVTKLHQIKAQLNETENNKYNGISVDLWRKRCYSLLWKRFSEFVMFQEAMHQLHDVTIHMKKKYERLHGKENREPLGESFKISMLKAVKDVKNVDIDRLLLCQDTKELTAFLMSSNMSQQLQLKVAAQLLPVVESHRVKLQREINTKIDKIIKKKGGKKMDGFEKIKNSE